MSHDTSGKEFSAPWGTLLRITSTLLVTVLLSVSFAGLYFMPRGAPDFARRIVALIGPLILMASAPFVVRSFRVAPGVILVRRLGWTTRISLMGIQSVKPDPDAMRRSIRLLGNGGGFVFAGLFRSRELGFFRAYVNDLSLAVVLRFPGRTIVVSPGDPAGFVEAIKAQNLFPPELP